MIALGPQLRGSTTACDTVSALIAKPSSLANATCRRNCDTFSINFNAPSQWIIQKVLYMASISHLTDETEHQLKGINYFLSHENIIKQLRARVSSSNGDACHSFSYSLVPCQNMFR